MIIVEMRQLNHRFRQVFAFGRVFRGSKRTKIDFGWGFIPENIQQTYNATPGRYRWFSGAAASQ